MTFLRRLIAVVLFTPRPDDIKPAHIQYVSTRSRSVRERRRLTTNQRGKS